MDYRAAKINALEKCRYNQNQFLLAKHNSSDSKIYLALAREFEKQHKRYATLQAKQNIQLKIEL